jgi:riboflavin kinase/FMN adenylyltransferase
VWRTATDGALPPGSVVAIGSFDGVHLGHQQVLARAASLARTLGGDLAVLTFDPHPARLLAPELAPPLICPVARRVELLGEAGARHVFLLPFTRELAATPAEDFVTRILVGQLGVAGVVVGYDFTFGLGGRGNTTLLREVGARCGLTVAVVEPYHHEGILVSSTKVREFALSGRVYGAATLLGRPLELSGTVVRGAGRGHQLGYPTANVAVEEELIPARGIYAARGRVEGEGHYDAAVSVGTNPTFTDGTEVVVEAHLLDVAVDLYGRRLTLDLVRRLRPERRFASAAELTGQIARDVLTVREILLTL